MSKKSEQRAADIFGGRRQPNSGAVNRQDLKGDVKSKHFLIEDKTTTKESYALSQKTWRTLSDLAWKTARRPAMRLEIQNTVLYLVDEQTMMDLLETAQL
jgi:hypothetical protein